MSKQYFKPAPILVPNVTDVYDANGNFLYRRVEGDPLDYDRNGDVIWDNHDDD